MTSTGLNPTHVDTIRAEQDEKLRTVTARNQSATDTVHRMAGDTHTRGGWGMTDLQALNAGRLILTGERPQPARCFYTLSQLQRELDVIAQCEVQFTAIAAAITALEDVFAAAGGWTRFWLVPDGHVHASTRCSTLHREGKTTTLRWLPELSGHSVDEAIEEFGELMCTVCFPSAPTDPRFAAPGTRARAAQDAKNAEKAMIKAARDAERAAKGITNPDGTPLVIEPNGYRDTIKTLVSARIALTDQLYWEDYGRISHEREGRPWSRTPGRDEAAELLIAAIAHKTGQDPQQIRAEHQSKADKKIRQIFGR